MYRNTAKAILFPLFLGLVLAMGILVGRFTAGGAILLSGSDYSFGRKMEDLRRFLTQNYVDSLESEDLENLSITSLLEHLDPHSTYIAPSDFQSAYEDLHGAFDGIGIEFNLAEDTIVVVSVVAGGPSEISGIRPGDRIVRVNDSLVAGTGITSEQVIRLLRGPRGTTVRLQMIRHGVAPFSVDIRRAKIPVNSVEAAFTYQDVGYIRLARFSDNTFEEFRRAYLKLDSAGMRKLILDLRNNPGGLLDQAVALSDFFLPKGSRIVSTRGAHRPQVVYNSRSAYGYHDLPLVVFIDRGSASASEIVAGAFQDNDRALIIGENSFGKGLVQEQVDFPDGSALRLTVARYYTPSGRCIQRKYEGEDPANYYLRHFTQAYDSVADSSSLKKFYTKNGRPVYESGGIQPDVVIRVSPEEDPLALPPSLLNAAGEFAFSKADKMRISWKLNFKSYRDFLNQRTLADQLLHEFLELQGSKKEPGTLHTRLQRLLMALSARHLWGADAYHYALLRFDPYFKAALQHFK
ncbi:MAG: S41 family peptidase [Flavobacteriales bacterium]|nr:S41 family peptidase [Flavobacteriales bacterium]MCX7650914.1 S41 family peptidase [Flavobacteriales bacterium]MDW8432832.1 S41 family peptidase [Flavobacteriales bacterium]